MRRFSALFPRHLMERRWKREEGGWAISSIVCFSRDTFWKRSVSLSFSPTVCTITQITEAWHSSACRHSPLKGVETSGIKLPIRFLPSFHFAICRHPQNGGDVNSRHILLRFYLEPHTIPNQKSTSVWNKIKYPFRFCEIHPFCSN